MRINVTQFSLHFISIALGIVSNDQLIAQSALTISKHLQPGFLQLLAKFNFAIACKNNSSLVYTLLPEDMGYSVHPLIKSRSNRFEDKAADVKACNQKVESTNTLLSQLHVSSESNEERQEKLETEYQSEKFPKLKLVDSQQFDSTDFSSFLHKTVSSNRFSLKAKNSHFALHHNLYHVWLASFIPDGFWPQLLTRIISDERISSNLSSLLHIPLTDLLNYVSRGSGTPSLWKLCQKGFIFEYEQTKVLELKEVSNKTRDFINYNELNLSVEYATQIELTIYNSQIAKLHNQEGSLEQSVVRFTSKLLVSIGQHILDITEEFPDVFTDSYNRVLSYVPCPLGLLQEDDCISQFDDSIDHHFLCFSGFNVYCFSMRELLDAYITESRSISCAKHKKMLVEQIAPDMVSSLLCTNNHYWSFLVVF